MKKTMVNKLAIIVKSIAVKSAESASPWAHQPKVPTKLLKK